MNKQELAIIKEKMPISAAESMLNMISEAAVNPKVDVAKLEKLMDLQERYLNREAANAYARDFVQMKPELPRVAKRKYNGQTKSNYAPLEDINSEIDPILSKWGFGTQTKILSQTEDSVTVQATVLHKGGHSESNTVIMPLDNAGMAGTKNKTDVHATASSITYAKRVALCALLNISTGDDKDGNKEEPLKETVGLKEELDKITDIDKLRALWKEKNPQGKDIAIFIARSAQLKNLKSEENNENI